MIDLSTLNVNQLKSVNWEDGPLLVLAGPGSGKTRVLAFRIARLIESTPNKYFRILGLTFTNKAAAEMRDRITRLVPNARERTLLTTFHSFAADLLRQHGHHIGLKPDFTILEQDADRHSLLDEAILHVEGGQLGQSGLQLLPLISRLTENDIDFESALQILRRGSFNESDKLATVYQQYRSLMIERNTLDFAGLIAETLSLLRNYPGIRKQVQRIYPYICVDEFQDTNLSQYKILEFLVNPTTKNLFVVADDDQIIFQWNGASPKRLRSLRDNFNMQLIQLPENYRCPGAVVDLANKLIAHNHERFFEKDLLTAHKQAPNDSVVTVQKFNDFSNEVDWVAKRIAGMPKISKEKCVVLARTRKLLEQVICAFDEYGVSGYLATRKNEFESASLQWLHSILRLANSRSNQEYLIRVCKAFFTLEKLDLNIHDIISHAMTEEGDYLRSWAVAVLGKDELSDITRQFIEVSLPALSDRLDIWQFLANAFEWLDCLPGTVPDQEGVFNEYQEEKDTWHQLVNEISAQHGKQMVTLHLLLQELDLRSKSPKPQKGAVPCFTIHASKGLEFDHVYLVGMVEDQLPSWAALRKGDYSHEMQEERRNCFVAITRAQETLTLTYSNRVLGWRKWPSRFLYEMGVLDA